MSIPILRLEMWEVGYERNALIACGKIVYWYRGLIPIGVCRSKKGFWYWGIEVLY